MLPILCSTLYNGARTGLVAASQSIPSLRNEKIQNIACILDCVDTYFALDQFCQLASKRWVKAHSDMKDKGDYDAAEDRFNQQLTLGMASILVGSFLFIKIMNYRLASRIDLKELLKNVVPLTDLKNVTVSWLTPIMHQIIQTLFLTRLVLNIGCTVLSKNPAYLVNSILQGIALFRTAERQGIRFVRTLPNPFDTLECTITDGGTRVDFQQNVKQLQTTFQLMSPTGSFTSNLPEIQKILQTAYEQSSNLFKGSSWRRFWTLKGCYGFKYSSYEQDPSSNLLTKFFKSPLKIFLGSLDPSDPKLTYEALTKPISFENLKMSFNATVVHEEPTRQWLSFPPGKMGKRVRLVPVSFTPGVKDLVSLFRKWLRLG